MEIRNRERDAHPFTTKDGSIIREYLQTDRQSLAEVSLAPSQSTRWHYHGRSQEVYLVLEGGGTLEVDGERATVAAGDAILIPAGAWHRLTAGDAGSRLLCCCVPAYSDDDAYFE